MVNYRIVIPARMESQRLPGKPLIRIAGRPLIEHVYRRACEASARSVVIATDSAEIRNAAEGFGADVIMTSADHASGSDRIAECIQIRGWSGDVLIVNLQGDEPLMPASLINQVATDLANHKDASITTLAYPLESSDNETDPNIVKVVLDREGYAMYFSRAPVPWHRDPGETGDGMEGVNPVLHHVGLYAYRAGFLKHFSELEQAPLEVFEKLEQLRALWHGFRIHVGITAEVPGPGVDTREDLVLVERLMTGD